MAAALFHNSGLTDDRRASTAPTTGSADAGLEQRRDIFGVAPAGVRVRLLVGRHDGRPGRDAGLHPAPDPDLRAPRRSRSLPALVIVAIGVNPSGALVFSQVVLSFGIPFALVPLLLIARKRDVMGALVNPRWLTAIASRARGADHRAQPLPAPAGCSSDERCARSASGTCASRSKRPRRSRTTSRRSTRSQHGREDAGLDLGPGGAAGRHARAPRPAWSRSSRAGLVRPRPVPRRRS